jgi:formate hydrogenlyase transcriptional activator
MDYWRHLLASGKAGEIEGRLRRFDGEHRWFLFRASPMRDESGQVVKWYGTNTDIDDRKRAEETLRSNEQSLRLIIDSIPGFVSILNAAGEIELLNRQVLEYFGKTFAELQNWVTSDAVHTEDLPRMIDAWRRAIETAQPVDLETRSRGADGVYRWFHVRSRPQRDAEGGIVRWYSLVTDIDERKRAEDDLDKAFQEIKRLKDRLHGENVVLREQIDQVFMFEEIVGSSSALKTALSSIVKVGPTDSTVLTKGETGTGKELIARAIHKSSERAGQAFIAVNCASIPSSLIASELFGHEKGAFTGALQRREGRFELAHSGTIFLGEIGELPAETQITLLRVLQERQFERVGGSRVIPTDVRIIAATNRDLTSAIASGTFRADLFYRLNVFPIDVPPLRERKEDIPMLVEYFVRRYAEKARKQIHQDRQKYAQALSVL